MRGVGRVVLASILGVAMAAGALHAQTITGLEKSRKSDPEGPTELLARLRGEVGPLTGSREVTPATLDETVEAAMAALAQPFKGDDAGRFTREQLVTLKLAMLRAEADLCTVQKAVDSGGVSAIRGRARVVGILAAYSELVGILDRSQGTRSSRAERR